MKAVRKEIADEIDETVKLVLARHEAPTEFRSRFVQLIHNAVNSNYDDSDVRGLIDSAPDPYEESN